MAEVIALPVVLAPTAVGLEVRPATVWLKPAMLKVTVWLSFWPRFRGAVVHRPSLIPNTAVPTEKLVFPQTWPVELKVTVPASVRVTLPVGRLMVPLTMMLPTPRRKKVLPARKLPGDASETLPFIVRVLPAPGDTWVMDAVVTLVARMGPSMEAVPLDVI